MPAEQPISPNLPPGLTDGIWDYLHNHRIADQYDAFFAQNLLFRFDSEVLARYLSPPGIVLDLGCGTGRSLIPLVRRGLRGLGVDLSGHMLRIAARKAHRQNLALGLVQANFAELDCLRSESVDYCICMFSTLGMIRGRPNRRRVLHHARRILKPGGLFVLHVHNFWHNLRNPRDASWLLGHLAQLPFHRDLERGDKIFQYRGIPRMFLHSFTRRELLGDLAEAPFDLVRLIPLHATRRRPLPRPWLLGGLRANGWIAVCRR